MEEYIFDCSQVKDPYLFLTHLLGVGKEAWKSIDRPVFIRMYSRDIGIKEWPEFMQLLETIQQESENLYIVWGPGKN